MWFLIFLNYLRIFKWSTFSGSDCNHCRDAGFYSCIHLLYMWWMGKGLLTIFFYPLHSFFLYEAGGSDSHRILLLISSRQIWPIKGQRCVVVDKIWKYSDANVIIKECLPNSDERAVVVSGSINDLSYCFYLICWVIIEVTIFIKPFWLHCLVYVSLSMTLPAFDRCNDFSRSFYITCTFCFDFRIQEIRLAVPTKSSSRSTTNFCSGWTSPDPLPSECQGIVLFYSSAKI